MIYLFVCLALPPQTDNNGEKRSIKRTNSFVGTAQFVAPEVLKRGTIHVGYVQHLLLKAIHFHSSIFFQIWFMGIRMHHLSNGDRKTFISWPVSCHSVFSMHTINWINLVMNMIFTMPLFVFLINYPMIFLLLLLI